MGCAGSSATACDQLPQEEVWPHQPASPEEEAEVDGTLWSTGYYAGDEVDVGGRGDTART